MTITRRLLLGFGLLLLIMVGVGIITSVHVRTMNEAVRQIMDIEQPTIEAAHKMAINMLETAAGVLMYLATRDERYRELMRKSAADVEEAKSLYHRVATTQTEREFGTRFLLLFQEFTSLGEAMMQERDRQVGLYDAVAANLDKTIVTLQKRIEMELDLGRPDASNRVKALGQMMINAAKVSLHLGDYLLFPTEEEREGVLNSIAAFRESLAHLATLLVSEEEKHWIGDLERLFNRTTVHLQEILAVSESLLEDTEGFLFLRGEMDHLLGEIQVLTRQDMLAAQARAEQTGRTLLLVVILLAIGALIIGGGTAVIVSRGIIGPVRKLVEGTEKIGRGVLDHRVKITTKDEFGELARTFNQMTEKRQRAEDELASLNLELEEKVAERTKELEAAVQAAEVASRAKSAFLAGMSHELRTPLNAVIGFSQVLQEQYFGELNEKQTEYVNDILGSGKHLLSLINDILDLSKVEAGKMELELTRVNIEDLLEGSLVMIKEKTLKHRINLAFHPAQDLERLEITADKRMLKQVMFNLLSNAAKFTPDGGAIEVAARQKGEELIISISDTGIGIVPEHQERIFEEFYQVRGGIRDKAPGTGLGLALSRSLVEMHGGKIWVESEGEGKGSRFSFVLPMKLKHSAEG